MLLKCLDHAFIGVENIIDQTFIDRMLFKRFQQYFSYIAADSAPIHAFLRFFYSAQYSFQATGCFPT